MNIEFKYRQKLKCLMLSKRPESYFFYSELVLVTQ